MTLTPYLRLGSTLLLFLTLLAAAIALQHRSLGQLLLPRNLQPPSLDADPPDYATASLHSSITDKSMHTWQHPGCHRLGHRRAVRIPGCVMFHITTNACRGYCPSLTVPSSNLTVATITKQFLTSKSQCCSITDTHNVKARVRCQDSAGYYTMREFTFKSAAQCSCSACAVT